MKDTNTTNTPNTFTPTEKAALCDQRVKLDVPMTELEAHAVLRAIAAGNASTGEGEMTAADKLAATWVANRIVRMLGVR